MIKEIASTNAVPAISFLLYMLMKRISHLLIFLLILHVSFAKDRTTEQKYNIALSTLSHKQANKRMDKRAKTSSENKLITLEEASNYTIIGYKDGGYVVIANDDAFQPVVGYSDTTLPLAKPANLQWWFDSMNATLEEMKKEGLSYYTITFPSMQSNGVAPLVTAQWNQGEPFNNQCPPIGGTFGGNYVTGCVATAMAQIMYTHRFPAKGIGSHEYVMTNEDGPLTLSADFGNTTYDWANMQDEYSNFYLPIKATAVATLMSHCGISVDMKYAIEGSASTNMQAAIAFSDFFGYNQNTRQLNRAYYNAEEWMEYVYHDINNGLPILYGATDKISGGHAFVIDGYDENGLVHVNWGWGPDGGNGFYDISILNPSGTTYKFNEGQLMVIGIDPYHSEPAELLFISDGISANKVNNMLLDASANIFNLSKIKFTGQVGLILIAENGNVTELKVLGTTNEPLEMDTYNGYTLNGSNPSLMVSSVPAGTYRLCVAAKAAGSNKWIPARAADGEASCYIFVKEASKYTITPVNNNVWTGITLISVNNSVSPSEAWYTIDGRRLNGEPTQRGIYIHNGQKVMK